MTQHREARARRCTLRLLGRWQLLADGEDIGLSHREERLTAVLGLIGRSSRLHVAGLLWPDSTDDRALASLRRAVLQTQKSCPGLLQADRLTIGLDPEVRVDVEELRRAAAAAEDAVVDGEAGALLGRLVGEELLPGWYDEWVVPERERVEQLRVKALERIARQALEGGDLELCIDAARAASDVNPLLESAGELAIRAHLGRGDLGSALLEFDRYRHAVREELGVPPSRAIRELIKPALAESRNPAESEAADLLDGVRAARSEAVAPAVGVDSAGRELQEFAALIDPTAATSTVRRIVTIPGRPEEPVVPARRRRALLRLLGVAAMLLAASLAVLGVGLTPVADHAGSPATGRGDTAVTGAGLPQTGVLPADRDVRQSSLLVRLVDAVAGRAAFLVRTTTQPALVRLELRGDAGSNIVRSVLVRSPQGRRLKLSGLRPGIYRWWATSPVASAVSGRLRIPEEPAVVPVVADTHAGTTIEAAAPATTAPSSVQPTAQSAAGSAVSASPGSHPTSVTQPRPTSRPRPTGQPKDPGIRPVAPVG
ncbi:hypothetical protein JCM18899A_37270 [Nocardioides sp. AN3]